jgi:hypothetical protein
LAGFDCLDHLLVVDRGRQRQLDEDSVHRLVALSRPPAPGSSASPVGVGQAVLKLAMPASRRRLALLRT